MSTYIFQVVSELELKPSSDGESSEVVSTSLRLNLQENIDQDKYLDKNAKYKMTEEGSKIVTATLVAALSSNIHLAHQNGYQDSAEHLRHIIKKLEDFFIQSPAISTSTLKV
jgi:hypothetical protein